LFSGEWELDDPNEKLFVLYDKKENIGNNDTEKIGKKIKPLTGAC
jgi:hypothetical protein